MTSPRRSGILLHPTSLPSRWGIGALDASAYAFVDFLIAAGQQLWQVMPLGPTGYGDSPYQGFSAFAGNPLLISLDNLLAEGLLADEDLFGAPSFPDATVDYGAVIPFKEALLRRSFECFMASAAPEQRDAFADFRTRNHAWLDDYALFAALKQAHGGANWNTWPQETAARQPEAIAYWTRELSDQIEFHAYLQFQFFSQWRRLKHYANERGVQIVGDIPIFVAYDSADVWANREIFALDDQGRPTVVAGVPPDYFSATGQLWGNPHYRWDVLARTGYAWWVERFRSLLALVDVIRIDHFRGFAASWEVPASASTAIDGTWVKGPGAALFEDVRSALALEHLPFVAENLGVITPDVEALRQRFGLPGMAILQFAFGTDPQAPDFKPHNYQRNLVVYTGTHDNDTTVGWWTGAVGHSTRSDADIADERELAARYLGLDGREIHWEFIRAVMASVAGTAIVPAQDLLGLGSEARMNRPGSASGNWRWRWNVSHLSPKT